jgi:protein-S-isoprenylcysteine O-methyltransferase Ste14
LATEDIYHAIRHPIYTAHLLWGAAQVLMVHNWLAGFLGFAAIALIMILRIPREERILIDQFGEEYSRYKQTTGALLPRLKR